MTTGDLKNNLRKFHAELKLINYLSDLDIEGLSIGRPSALLPVLHFVLTEFSVELAQYFYSKDYELLGKNDKNFVSVIYRILRDEFDTKPPLTKEQFFTLGFAERKLQFVTCVIQLCRKKGDILKPKRKKNLFVSNSAKTSKFNVPFPGKTIGTQHSAGTVSLVATSSETMAMNSSQFSNFSKSTNENSIAAPGQIDKRIAYNPDKPVSEDQILKKSERNGQSNVLKNTSIQGSCLARVVKNVASDSLQSPSEMLPRINPLLPEQTNCYSNDKRHPYCDDRSIHTSKENVCPNSGRVLADDVDDVAKPKNQDTVMLSPIPLSDKMATISLEHPSEKQVDGYESNMPFVSFSERLQSSRHIFVTKPTEDALTPIRNESLDVSLLDEYSGEYAEILNHVREQDKKISNLENEVIERNKQFEELLETNSKLNARVIVLETTVALLMEKLD